jgi:long-subunit acyl-CoA synthetase (AMP-forming)
VPEPQLVEMSLFEYLFPKRGNQSPLPVYDRKLPAYIDGLDGRTITRGGIEDEALRMVSGLKALGVNAGDTACVWGLNSLEWVRAAFGCMAAGVTISPANAA